MKWQALLLLLLGCALCGCEDSQLKRVQQQNVMVQAEIKQCQTAVKAIEHERSRLADLLEKEKALQAEIKSLQAKKH